MKHIIIDEHILRTGRILLLILCFVFVSFTKSTARPPLDVVLNQAVSHSQQLTILDEEIEKARLQRKMVYQNWLPKAQFESSVRFLDEDIAFGLDPMSIPMPTGGAIDLSIPPLVLQDKQSLRATVEVTQPLFTGLKVPRMGRAARHGENAAAYQAESGRQQVLLSVSGLYDQLFLVDEAMCVIDRADIRLQEEIRIAHKAYEEGMIPAYDLTRIDIAVYELEKNRISLEGKRDMIAWKLEHLTGMDRSLFINQAEGDILQIPTLNTELDGEPPAVMALREANHMAYYSYRAQQSDYLPQAFAFYRRELYEEDLSILDPVRVFGVGLRWTIFDGYNRTRRIQLADRERVILSHRLDEAESLSRVNQRQSEVAMEVAARQLAVAKSKKKDAETAMRLSTRRYRLGLAPVSEKLEAETGYQQAEREYLEAVLQKRTAYREFLLANGVLDIDLLVLMNQ